MRLATVTPAIFLSIAVQAVAAASDVSPRPGIDVRDGAPRSWRDLSEPERKAFRLGEAVFNTHWAPANAPAGRRDGLGPFFTGPSCDACHNEGRRRRGLPNDGRAPIDLVIQLGQRRPDGSVSRGSDHYGLALNTSAIAGFTPEGQVFVRIDKREFRFPDGGVVTMHVPTYTVNVGDASSLPAGSVLMPRVPPSIGGLGLLERVPVDAITEMEDPGDRNRDGVSGRASWLPADGSDVLGRFGWQASEASISSQTASAFASEMGLSTELLPDADCGVRQADCRNASKGGTPEVEPELFAAVVRFQELHAVCLPASSHRGEAGARLFQSIGCADCHRPELAVSGVDTGGTATAFAYTDLLLHDLGDGLADRDLAGNAVTSEWRTAPLWGIGAADPARDDVRFLHDGRARSIEEAILWHGGEAERARERFTRMDAAERAVLVDWISEL